MSTSEIIETKLPSANVPPSSNTCEVSVIDTTTDLVVKTSALMEPEIGGHEFLNLPTFAFYIYNPRLDKRVLFDMGSRKDWWNSPPAVVEAIEGKSVPGIKITKGIDEILSAGGIDPEKIDAVVWSHYHWDHVGNIKRFPLSTKIIVGNGFRSSFLPGYPTNTTSPFYEDDFKDRDIHEITFDNNQSLQIGGLQVFDYFGDQSFYILNTPGHTAGHISSLVRTTADTFVFLGGDISHFPGMYRSTGQVPMPEVIPSDTRLDCRIPHPCPCSLFTICHPGGTLNGCIVPFYRPLTKAESWYENSTEAQKSLDGMVEFDGDENVFVAIAHDSALREVHQQFPQATMNDWKVRQWKDIFHWHFLNELPLGGKPDRSKSMERRLKDEKADC